MAGFTQKTIDFIVRIITRRQEKSPIGEEYFTLVVTGFPEETFTVVKFSTQGELNQCYRAELIMVTQSPNLDIKKVLLSQAFAFIKRDEKAFVPFSGLMVELEEMKRIQDYIFYRAVIVPKMWLLTQSQGSQIYLDKTIPEIIEEVLVGGGLTKNEFEFRLQGDYSRRREYVCQYGESHFSFLLRWLEHEGMYFYLEHTDEGDKIIITDTKIAHLPPPFSLTLQYHPSSGLEMAHWEEVLSSFSACYSTLPKSVTLKDYNYRRPSLELSGKAEVAEDGFGDVFIYGGHLQTPEEANRVAKIRAEEIHCRQMVFHGASRAPFLRPGFIFEVQGHYQQEYCGKYMITKINHEGNQVAFLTAGLRGELDEGNVEPFYRNTFTAIPADVQYRPPLITAKPRFFGVINAHIDAESSGEYAELDSQGRYKVVLPFDLSGRKSGRASSWLRMAQPYVGDNHGMHFPLHKGTEVLLTFIDGDPDRPIITGAVPNPLKPSLINDQSATKAGFVTPGGSCLVAQDMAGQEQVTLRQGNDAMFTLTGSGLGSEAGTRSNFAWHYAGMGALAVANAYTYNYCFGTFIQSVGFRKQALGIYSALVEGSNLLPELLPSGQSADAPSSLMEKVIPLASMGINVILSLLIERQVKARVKSKLPGVPKVGYGIYCDNSGAITYMKAPWTQDNPDIGVTSATGSIDVDAGKSIVIWADEELRAGATDHVTIHAGRDAGTVDISGDKVNITSSGRGVNIKTGMEGVKIVTELGKIDIKSEFGPIHLSRESSEGQSYGSVNIDGGGVQAKSPNGRITLKSGETSMDISSTGFVKVTATHGLTIMVGDSKVEVELAGITITSPYDVKINDLTIAKTSMSYKGTTANIANVLKIK